jgi:hypothetical protein
MLFLFLEVFVLRAPSYFSLRERVRVFFSRCFSFACFFQARLIYIYIYIYILQLEGSVRRVIWFKVIRVCAFFGHCYKREQLSALVAARESAFRRSLP